MLTQELVARLYDQAKAGRWAVPVDLFKAALEASIASGPGRGTGARELERYLSSLHLEDLTLACACAAGNEAAWEHFVLEHRPKLYRAADALDPGGGARELADSLYADLYGLQDREGERRSLFSYFHGRSSLATWLRAVLAQRQVDRVRSERRFEPLLDQDDPPGAAGASSPPDPERARYLALMQKTLARAISQLPARDRLRLGCYYAQELTLAETGRVLGEHEATVSRQLARTRRAIKLEMERHLRAEGLRDDEVIQCFECAAEDAGPIDLDKLLGPAGERKISAPQRSISGESM